MHRTTWVCVLEVVRATMQRFRGNMVWVATVWKPIWVGPITKMHQVSVLQEFISLFLTCHTILLGSLVRELLLVWQRLKGNRNLHWLWLDKLASNMILQPFRCNYPWMFVLVSMSYLVPLSVGATLPWAYATCSEPIIPNNEKKTACFDVPPEVGWLSISYHGKGFGIVLGSFLLVST